MAVNLSARQVVPDFNDQVQRVLADEGLPAEYLEIELTESAAFGDPAIFSVLDALRDQTIVRAVIQLARGLGRRCGDTR